jgi:hypothetical protein
MSDRVNQGSPSGDPNWRVSGPRLPIVPAPPAPPPSDSEIASEPSGKGSAAGWSPTEWRRWSSGSQAGVRP